MKKLLAAALLAGVAIAGATSADARDGCGPGGHRGPYGHCRPSRGPGYGGPGYRGAVVAPGLVIGNFYNGRGYWDGHRYWHNRYRDHGNWRYR